MSQTQLPLPNNQDPRATFPNLEGYLALKTACCTDHKDAFRRLLTKLEVEECVKYLSEWPDMRVADQWKLGEPKGRPQAAIETAMRCVPSFTVLFYLAVALQPSTPSSQALNLAHAITQVHERVHHIHGEPRSRALRP